MPVEGGAGTARRGRWARQLAVAHRRAQRWPAAVRGMLWSAAAGLLFVVLNTILRGLSLQMDPFQAQCLRYVGSVVIMLPLVLRTGVTAWRPLDVSGQFARGGVHTFGLCLWFTALPHITLADTTAIGFTTPIFMMVGAVFFFGEPMRWDRWAAALVGFAGMLAVVGPQLTGSGGMYTLLMLASSPVFATSFLLTKRLARYERTEVIVLWQALTVALLSVPLALWNWSWPTAWQWLLFLLCGLLGSGGHYCLTRSLSVADVSATQSMKFLELVWAAAIGWLLFADIPSRSTLVGGVVICAATLWIARREARGRAPAR